MRIQTGGVGVAGSNPVSPTTFQQNPSKSTENRHSFKEAESGLESDSGFVSNFVHWIVHTLCSGRSSPCPLAVIFAGIGGGGAGSPVSDLAQKFLY